MLTRTELRQLVVEKLTGATFVGNSVYDSRLNGSDEDLPMISVFTPSELDQDGMLLVTLEVSAMVMANKGEDVATLADNLCEEIRTALRRFWESSGRFTASYLGTDISFETDAVQTFAAATMSYEVEILIEE